MSTTAGRLLVGVGLPAQANKGEAKTVLGPRGSPESQTTTRALVLAGRVAIQATAVLAQAGGTPTALPAQVELLKAAQVELLKAAQVELLKAAQVELLKAAQVELLKARAMLPEQ